MSRKQLLIGILLVAIGCGATVTPTLINLATQVKGLLSAANGGTGASSFTAHGVLFGNSTSPFGVSSAGTAHQYMASGGASANGSYQDHPDIRIIPAANDAGGTAGGGWNYASGQFTPTGRAGSNNVGGALQAVPSSGAAGQFQIELPLDWDTGSQPYINIFYASGSNTSGTVIWTVSSACTKADGSVTDDPAFNAESAFASQTMATANRMWSQAGQFTAITSGNNCIPGGALILKVAISGTASSNINAYQAVVTIPRQPVGQAN